MSPNSAALPPRFLRTKEAAERLSFAPTELPPFCYSPRPRRHLRAGDKL